MAGERLPSWFLRPARARLQRVRKAPSPLGRVYDAFVSYKPSSQTHPDSCSESSSLTRPVLSRVEVEGWLFLLSAKRPLR